MESIAKKYGLKLDDDWNKKKCTIWGAIQICITNGF